MIHVMICDDERLHLENTASIIDSALPEEHITTCFLEAGKLLNAIEFNNYEPNIAVLDICMDGMDGVDLAKRINLLAPDCQIIFLTSYAVYASDVYETDHVYFILKSELNERIAPALKRAMNKMTDIRDRFICIKQGSMTVRVKVHGIEYLERFGHKTRVVTRDEVLLTSASPAKLLSEGMAAYFIRCHQSYWVNSESIIRLEKTDFVLNGDVRIPISRTYRAQAREQFINTLK